MSLACAQTNNLLRVIPKQVIFPNATSRENNMNRIISAIVALSFLASGCSAFVPKTQTISAACSESDAVLQINGQTFQGKAQVETKRNKTVSIMCTKEGYFPAQKSVDYSLSGTGVADTIGTFIILLPGIGLFTAGAWNLDETEVSIVMVKNGK